MIIIMSQRKIEGDSECSYHHILGYDTVWNSATTIHVALKLFTNYTKVQQMAELFTHRN